MPACIEKGYDLSDLDTDHLYAGDTWTIPLGRAVVSASDILDVDSVDEIFQDADGDYVARFSDMIYAVPEESPAVVNQTFILPPVNLSGIAGGVSPGGNITVPRSATNLDITGNQYVLSLYRAEFNTSATESLMRISMTLTDLMVSSGTAALDIELPSGFEVDGSLLPAGLTASGAIINWQFDIGGRVAADITVPIKVVDLTGGNEVSISGYIDVPSGADISTGAAAAAGFSVGFEELDYAVIYGLFDLDFTFSPASADISGLQDIFEGGALLSFRDPHFIVESESNMGIPVAVSLDIYSDSAADPVEVDDIVVPGAENPQSTASEKFWIGETRPYGDGYVFARAEGLNEVIKNSREYIYISGHGAPEPGATTMFFPKGGQATLGYTLEIPFAPASDFYAVTRQEIENAFDGDIVDYLFTGGTADIFGTAINAIPLGFDLTMIITDSAGDPVGITIPSRKIAGPVSPDEPSVTEVSFPISEEDMDKMKYARNLVLHFVAVGIEDAPALNSSHELVLNLKIGKTGGIHVSGSDDNN
ncbi:MAG: DUF4621 domain-containing protein [Rikenellaceae bacterium]|nr:DUF4621 domain-containing protein [Rikenellaceae bacterium]